MMTWSCRYTGIGRALTLAVAVAALSAACSGNKATKKNPAPDASMDRQDAYQTGTEVTPPDGPSFDVAPWDAARTDRGTSLSDAPSADLAARDAPSAEGKTDSSDTPLSDLPSNTAPDAGGPNTTRDSTAWNAPLFFSDEKGTWSVTPDGQTKLIVARANAAQIHPSPFLDRLALVWQGQGTEIYDQQGQLLGGIPGDRFSGWTSNEAVVVNMGQWDIRGQAIHAFTAPTETPSSGAPRSMAVRQAAVSPDGQWLAADYSGMVGGGTYLHATNDGSKTWMVGRGGPEALAWSRGGDSVGLYKGGVTQLYDSFKRGKWLALPSLTSICAGQAWVSNSTFLVWTFKPSADTAYCADPYVVDTTQPDAAPVPFVPTTAFAEASDWDARGKAVFVISPDGQQIAYRLTKGIVIANPDGSNPRTILTDRNISSLAWDSPNPRARGL